MNELNEEAKTMNDEQVNACSSDEPRILDYDEQPYGNDNVLVRASKRRAYLMASSKL